MAKKGNRVLVKLKSTESGHMYYIHVDSLQARKRDVASVLQWAAQ